MRTLAALTHEAGTALPFMQAALARAQVALQPPVTEQVRPTPDVDVARLRVGHGIHAGRSTHFSAR